jgi:hypothetical protein
MNRRHSLAAISGIVAGLVTKSTAAQVQTVGNQGQIVSTGDVTLSQDAAGNQVVYDVHGQIIATQAVGNDLQIVSTGDVIASQRAAGSQTVIGSRSKGECAPGEWYQYAEGDGGCLFFCNEECEWLQFCCEKKAKCKGRC